MDSSTARLDRSAPPRPGSRRLWASIVGVISAAILAVGVNVLAARLLPPWRLDLTEQRIHTMSDGTRQILAAIPDTITMRLFYSRRLGAEVPVFGAYADRVTAIMREYVAIAGGKLRLEILDPEPFSEIEDRALGYGLQGVPVDQSGEQVYFGLVAVNLLDDERTIGFLQPDRERFLEYDLTKLLWELSNPRRAVLGVMSSLPLNGDPRAMMMRFGSVGQPYAVMQQLRQVANVKDVTVDAQVIDPDIQVLLVAHVQGLTEATHYAIDQFVMRGGKLILLVDPHSEGQAARPNSAGQGATRTGSSLKRLLHAWGMDAPEDRVVLDLRGAWRVRASPQDRVQAVDYVAWFTLQGDSLHRGEVATAQLEQVTLASAGEVRRQDGVEMDFVPLLTSSAQSMVVPVDRVRQDPNPARLLAEFQADGERRVLAARIRATLHSAFPDGPPAPDEGQSRPAEFPPHRAASDGAVHMVVINDSDLLEDRFWVRTQDFFGQQIAAPFSGNGAFVVNLVDMLAGSDALISLRSRGESMRPFELVEDIRRKADAQFRQTERQLQSRLEETERRLRELRQGPQGSAAQGATAPPVITMEQRAEIDAARDEIVRTRRELRTVQLELRRDIEALELTLRAINIALVPLLLIICVCVFAVIRMRRRAAALT